MSKVVPGMIVLWPAHKDDPDGWVACDGRNYKPTEYPLLHHVLGRPLVERLPELYFHHGPYRYIICTGGPGE